MKKSKVRTKAKTTSRKDKAIATMRKAISEFTDDYMSERDQPNTQKRKKIN